ncbi:unnamed protein product [Ilex paraguariensis]|uniref:Uncharacterized protein n=1 Tax=Ilex paraguariensis TaxID=185542 RepID=A0ABC8T3J1_9AQUA
MVLKQLSQSPSSVTWACDPSGGIKVMEHWVKPDGKIRCCNCWSARSKHRAEPRCSGEGWSLMAPREEGNASGWLHRAARTSRSMRWMENGSERA